ncbi:MAG: hypothetical protein P1S60_15820, partial [Anaerolineae bacterium]|nr:hypothetical protein [Anaerolineae bacterium]
MTQSSKQLLLLTTGVSSFSPFLVQCKLSFVYYRIVIPNARTLSEERRFPMRDLDAWNARHGMRGMECAAWNAGTTAIMRVGFVDRYAIQASR